MNAMEAKVALFEDAVVASSQVIYRIAQVLGTVCQVVTGSGSRLGGVRNVLLLATFSAMLLFCAAGLYSIFLKPHPMPAATQLTTSRVILAAPVGENVQ